MLDGKIYDPQDNVYVREGTYEYFDGSRMVEKDCSEALMFTNPSVPPSIEEAPPGSLPGPECTLRKIGDHSQGYPLSEANEKKPSASKYGIEKPIIAVITSQKKQACWPLFNSYAVVVQT